MANVLNTLYPPQVDTFMPAFPRKLNNAVQDAVVYYSLSPYNDVDKIKRVHVSVVDAASNSNALQSKHGIIIVAPEYDKEVGLYKVTIPNSEMYTADTNEPANTSRFKINQFYKVQLRFDLSSNAPVLGDDPVKYQKELGSYLISERANFSEWSSVCLIRAILEPQITLKTFDAGDKRDIPSFNKGVIPISGTFGFKNDSDSSETDTLESYIVQIIDPDSGKVLINSGRVFTGNGNLTSNNINYRIDVTGLAVENNKILTMRILYTTKNQYSGQKDYPLQIVEYIYNDAFRPEIKVSTEYDDGIVHINVKNDQAVYGILYVKRSSNRTHHREWETVYMTKVAGPFDLDVYDNTIASSQWYRYSVQLEEAGAYLSQIYKSNKIMVDFYDAILSRGSRQYAIRYNYVINSFKPTVSRVKIDTLGGKYPKFAENARMNYKQFTITGLITVQEDPSNRFFDKESYYKNANSTYSDPQTQHIYDYDLEREFREELVKWLNDGNPKLYRSQTEGNMVVMLTDISLTPNATLSRMIWNFSATVYEIEDGYDMEVLDYLGVYDVHDDGKGGDGTSWGDNSSKVINSLNERFFIEKEIPYQVYNHLVTNQSDIVSKVIAPDIESRYVGVLDEHNATNIYIRNVKIFFHNKPHAYYIDNNGEMVLITKDTVVDRNTPIVYGYRLIVNNDRLVFVNADGYYQIPNDVKLKSISFPDVSRETTDSDTSDVTNERVTIECIVGYDEEQHTMRRRIEKFSIYKSAIGQIHGVFQPEEYLRERIAKKHIFVRPDTYFLRLDSLAGACVEVDPLSIINVRFINTDEYVSLMTDRSGILHILDDCGIKDMYFSGRRFTHKINCSGEPAHYELGENLFLEEWEYVLVEDDSYQNPLYNHVYNIDGKYQIYHKDGKWYDFIFDDEQNLQGTGTAKIPVDGMINYHCDIIRGDYVSEKEISIPTESI